MSIQGHVAALKEHLETLFPGKWVSPGQERRKTLLTGVAEIDQSLPRGLARQHITEWGGPASSGKTTILRAVIANWCASWFNVAYVDTGNKLIAYDWAFVEQGKCNTVPDSMDVRAASSPGRFWVIRPSDNDGGSRRFAYIWPSSQLI